MKVEDLQDKINARAEKHAGEVYSDFWKRHTHGSLHAIEGVPLDNVVKILRECQEFRGVKKEDLVFKGTMELRALMNQFAAITALVAAYQERERLQNELVDLAEKLYGGELEE